jgi:hypothetical protein
MSPDRGFGGWPPTLSTLMGREKKRGVQGAQPPGQGGQGGEAPRKILKKRVLRTNLSMHDLSKIPQFSKIKIVRIVKNKNKKIKIKIVKKSKIVEIGRFGRFENDLKMFLGRSYSSNLRPVRRLCCINILQKTACL